jgi:hypothetical protein
MQNEASSALVGTLGLTLALIAALTLAWSRSGVAAEHLVKVRRIAVVAVVLQAGHFGEEYLQQFYLRFPVMLGLAPWSDVFFVAFNLIWLAVWLFAIAGLARFPRVAAFPLWFLAIASTANGIAHPLLSLAASGYFPGLWSSPLVGIVGVVLLSALASATRGQSVSGHQGG